jgi:hypothetical protein
MEVFGWVYILDIAYVCATDQIAQFQAVSFASGRHQARVRRFGRLESRPALAGLHLRLVASRRAIGL